MSKGSIQKYQHYLPATYIRRFKPFVKDAQAGENTVYGFVKIEATSKQIKERISYLNLKKICGQEWRHTIYIDGERDNLIEDCFKILEDTYPEFIGCISDFYRMKDCFRAAKGNHYFVRCYSLGGDFKRNKFKRSAILSRAHEIDLDDLKNVAIFMARFLCYRNEILDEHFKSRVEPRLRDVTKLIKGVLNTNKPLFPAGAKVLPRGGWRMILSMFGKGGGYFSESEKPQRKEALNMLSKMYRYVILPFSSIADEVGCRVYIYAAPEGRGIVSGDFPFIFSNKSLSFRDGCVFTISPGMALVISSNDFPMNVDGKFADAISEWNVRRAKKYVFSSDKERLEIFTKDVKQVLNQSYGRKSKK